MPLRVIPHFSIMGNVDDTVIMVNRIREKFPHQFIGLAGLSAGSGQVLSQALFLDKKCAPQKCFVATLTAAVDATGYFLRLKVSAAGHAAV